MAVSRWANFASKAVVPVFAATGADAWGDVQELRGVPAIRLVTSPRHATVLLVAGTVPDDHLEALQRTHDQLPHPRAVVAWRPGSAATRIPSVTVDDDLDVVVQALRRAFSDVVADPARSADDLLADVEPNEWRGVGPFGQGGEGMMGGTPYGRPMTMTGDDRDGLALDRLHLRLGPFLDALPAGLVLDVSVQGEVLQRVELTTDAPVVEQPRDVAAAPHETARGGLRWLAHALHVEGLDALAARAAFLARRITDDGDTARSVRAAAQLRRRIRTTGVLRTLRGVGRLTADDGAPHDWGTDAADRWRVRLDTVVAALDGSLADSARGQVPAGSSADVATVLSDVLVGMTVTDAVSTIVSLDLTATVFRGGRSHWVGAP